MCVHVVHKEDIYIIQVDKEDIYTSHADKEDIYNGQADKEDIYYWSNAEKGRIIVHYIW